MKISQADADLFFELMWLLQVYVNNRHDIHPDIQTVEDYLQLSSEQKIIVREAIYAQPDLISEYTDQNPNQLSKEKIAIVRSWTRFVKGKFHIERYLKNHAIFISDKKVYAVHALHESFDEMFHKSYLPLYVEAVLLPFKDQIVYDGLIRSYNVFFGGNIKRSLNEVYQKAKQNARIVTCLTESKNKALNDQPIDKKDWSHEIQHIEAIVKKLKGGETQPVINGPVFSLLKTVVELTQQAVVEEQSRDVLSKQYNKTVKALNKVERIIDRME